MHTTNQKIADSFSQLKCCIIIPTYNNSKTLQNVIEGVLQYTPNIIVVNDGSTDNTATILKAYSHLSLITLPKNRGKGNALKTGFKEALRLGYEHAITIDSDGQHYPEDLPIFIAELEKSEDKKLLLIGSRKMDQEGIPKQSSFGNKFSNFWYWAETGYKLSDTQSGYRSYPIKALEKTTFYSTKFEFEIEIIVRASWKGIKVKNIPIQVYYDQEDRVSHFRPIKDFLRISVLNTCLILIALIYIKPRDFFRRFKKKGFKRFFKEDILQSQDSPQKKSLSIVLGLFIGLSPLWGFHTALVISLSVIFKLNKVIAFAFSHISFPPFIPFIIYFALYVGNWITGDNSSLSLGEISTNFGSFKHLKSYIIGSFTVALIASITIGFLSYILLSFLKSKKNNIVNG